MACRLSTRLSLRWLPDEPFETTDTLVMGVGGWFIDLRVTKTYGSIDWAMAGERIIISKEPYKCSFTHIIDSRGQTEPDEGTFQSISTTDSLETGIMPNPDNDNKPTSYEELWRELSIPFPEKFPGGWILRSEDSKTFIGRVGGEFLALSESRQCFNARRECWNDETQSWTVKYLIGETASDDLPSLIGSDGSLGNEWKTGDEVKLFGKTWVVCSKGIRE